MSISSSPKRITGVNIAASLRRNCQETSRSRSTSPGPWPSRSGKRIAQEEVVAASLEADERSPYGVFRGKQFSADEVRAVRSRRPGQPPEGPASGTARRADARRRSHSSVRGPASTSTSSLCRVRPTASSTARAESGAASRGDLDPSRRRKLAISQAPRAGGGRHDQRRHLAGAKEAPVRDRCRRCR